MIKKFHAATTRDCLRAVRDALGANAIILSNRKVEGGVEIIAVADMDVAALTEQAEPIVSVMRSPRRQPAMEPPAPKPVPVQAAPVQPTPAQPAPQAEPPLTTLAEFVAQREQTQPTAVPKPEARAAAPTHSTGPAAEETPAAVLELVREVRILRGLVEGQLAGFAWSDLNRRAPVRAELMKVLVAAGFSASLSNQLTEKLPEGSDLAKAVKWVRSVLAHNLKTVPAGDDLVERGGIYALVGPTGVGKTTTVAKLAARAVLKYGASQVALITTDSYRIGAQDQLRIYGRILGVPVYAVRDENDLELTLADLAGKHLVLIDTVGMGQRDRRVAEQAAFLSGGGRGVRRVLLLSAPAQGMTLEEVIRSYSGAGLFGCILTKIDEALTYGPSLDAVVRHQLKLLYVTNGQRVPEDLHVANPLYLVDRAFKQHQDDSPFAVGEDEIPVLMAAERTAAPIHPMDEEGALGAVG